jgi:hypothetical protein
MNKSINYLRCNEGFAPAIMSRPDKMSHMGKIYLPEHKNDIHSSIYLFIEKPTKAELKADDDLSTYYARMNRLGYIEGFVILETGDFLTRDEMEELYEYNETITLRQMYRGRGLPRLKK